MREPIIPHYYKASTKIKTQLFITKLGIASKTSNILYLLSENKETVNKDFTSKND